MYMYIVLLSYGQVLVDNGFPKDSVMVIAGLSNTYSSYVATYEEYQVLTYSVYALSYMAYSGTSLNGHSL